MNKKENLLLLLKQKSYTPGIVTLSSGETSDFYIDVRKLSLTYQGSQAITSVLEEVLYDNFNQLNYNIAGEGIGGIALAMSLAFTFPEINCLCIRQNPKTHGLSKGSAIEGSHLLKPNDDVFLVEDVISTGNSVLNAANTIKAAGFNVKAIIALIDRQSGGAEKIRDNGYNLITIFNKGQFL